MNKSELTSRHTASVFEAVDGVGQEAHTAQEPGPLLLMDLLVVPHTDGDGVRFTDIPAHTYI